MNTRLIKPLLQEKGLLTEQKWVALLEWCREGLNPFLDKFTLPKFGDLACMQRGNGFYETVSKHNPKDTGKILLSEPGITGFCDMYSGEMKVGENRTIEAWGLSKKGRWVLILIEVECISAEAGHPDWQHAKSVSINEVGLVEMLEIAHVKPLQVLRNLTASVEDWERQRKARYEEAKALADGMRLFQHVLLHNFI